MSRKYTPVDQNDEMISVSITSLRISIELSSKETKFFKNAKFTVEDGEFIKKTDIISQKDEKMLSKLCDMGLVRYRVTDWGSQEHNYYLTDVGKAVKHSLHN